MKKLLISLLILTLLVGCNASGTNQEVIEPTSFEPTTTSKKQGVYYIYPIADKDGNMVIPLNTDCAIITADETKSAFMQAKFEEVVIHYHKLLDPTHEFDGINNIKTINDNYGLDPVKVEPELIELLDKAITLSELTDGYFNPTIGAVSNVWKDLFNQEHKNNDPDEALVKENLEASIPYDQLRDYIVLDKTNNTVTFKKLETTDINVIIDLGAISKGYVLDKAYEALLKYKAGFLLSAGGSSIVTYVEPTQEKLSWMIGVKNPDTGQSCFEIKTKNMFISTSGDTQQHFINENGIRRHHILNPYTGYSENNYRSITLISEYDAAALDALSTALYSSNDIEKLTSNVKDKYNIDIKKALIFEDENKNLILDYDDNMIDDIYEVDTTQLEIYGK